MANRRSIYDAGTYSSPLADFLEQIPNYFLQWEQLKQAGEQQAFTNELNIIKMLEPEHKSLAMATSKNPAIQKVGASARESSQTFLNRLNPINGDYVDAPSKEITYLEKLLEDPAIAPYSKRKVMIEDRINRLKPKVANQALRDYFADNPDHPNRESITALAKSDPESALRTVAPYRTSASREPKHSLTQINAAIESVHKAFRRSKDPDKKRILQDRLDRFTEERDKLIMGDSTSDSPAESTKTFIPGW